MENTNILTNGNSIFAPSSGSGLGSGIFLIAGNSGGSVSGATASVSGGNATGTGYGGIASLLGGSGGSSTNGGGPAFIQGGAGGSGTGLGGQASVFGGVGAGTNYGGTAVLWGGTGGPTAGHGGNVSILGGCAGSAAGAGGAIFFATTTDNTSPSLRMQITNAGTVEVGPANQFTVDQSGNMTTSGHIATTSAIGAVTHTAGVTSASAAGSDVAGVITFTSIGSAAVESITVNFGTTYTTPPVVVITPGNSQGGSEWGYSVTTGHLVPYVTCNATSFVVSFYDIWAAAGGTLNYIVVH